MTRSMDARIVARAIGALEPCLLEADGLEQVVESVRQVADAHGMPWDELARRWVDTGECLDTLSGWDVHIKVILTAMEYSAGSHRLTRAVS
jgi:predicted SpoU family rRNA methylase